MSAGKLTYYVCYRWGAYFRIRGYGAALSMDLPVLFSERYGHRRVYRLGRVAFQWLKPTAPAGAQERR
jgi:hypothetical protein